MHPYTTRVLMTQLSPRHNVEARLKYKKVSFEIHKSKISGPSFAIFHLALEVN